MLRYAEEKKQYLHKTSIDMKTPVDREEAERKPVMAIVISKNK